MRHSWAAYQINYLITQTHRFRAVEAGAAVDDMISAYVHNDGDTAVPQFQGIEFITAMRRLGKTAYMFSFDGEKHGITSRENQKYWTVSLDEWFDYWLKGAKRPSWFDGVPFLQRGERNADALFGD